MRKQKGFSLIELLIVVAIILIIAAIAIPNLMSARRSANESAGAATVRTLNTSEVTYSTTWQANGYAPDLKTLGPNGVDCTVPANVTATSACLIDNVLGCATAPCKKGAFGYTLTSSASAVPYPDYLLKAIGLGTALSKKDFCSTTDAVVRWQVSTGSSTIASAAACGALNAL
jgi:prepilin-type N-terminal cleavage/methylation domain-containing protein